MMQLGTVSNDNDDSTQPMTLHALQQRANSVASGTPANERGSSRLLFSREQSTTKSVESESESESEYFINPWGGIVFVPDALCKVEIEIWHKWKQETKIHI